MATAPETQPATMPESVAMDDTSAAFLRALDAEDSGTQAMSCAHPCAIQGAVTTASFISLCIECATHGMSCHIHALRRHFLRSVLPSMQYHSMRAMKRLPYIQYRAR